MSNKPNEMYIGDWVVYPEKYEKVTMSEAIEAFNAVYRNPIEFDFSVYDLIEVAETIFKIDKYQLGIKAHLHEMRTLPILPEDC